MEVRVSGRENTDQTLLKFLYRAPFALVQASLDGEVEMMSPVAVQLLLPLAPTRRLDNIFDVLVGVAPRLRSLCAGFSESSGTICEALYLDWTNREDEQGRQILSISVFKLSSCTLMLTLSDVTAQRRRLEEAATLQRVAEQANRAKTRFLTVMSHELRTPLNAILGLSELLQMSRVSPLTAEQAFQVRHIRAAGTHLLNLISDLLDMSRIESGNLHLRNSKVWLDELVRDAIQEIAPLAASRQVRVSLDEASLHRAVLADATRVLQVILNLLSNAVKYNREGGEVSVRCERAGEAWRVDIADTGIGMTEEQLQGLFQPFNRLGREADGVQGVGIGLFVSRQLTEAMGGGLAVSSVPHEGSVFSVRLPAFNDIVAS